MKTFQRLCGALLFPCSFLIAFALHASDYPGTRSEWFGYESYDFIFEGKGAKIVLPHQAAEGNPWVWRARFFGHEPQADLAMLEKGYSIAFLDATPLMGSPKSVAFWQRFYLYLTEEFNFSKKPVLEGMSRGGLYIMNWAIAYPDEVGAIYIDNPVLDFKSWPGGYGNGSRSEGDWNDVLASYGLTQEEAMAYSLNPIDNPAIKQLAEKKVPILAVCGDADRVVPFKENSAVLIEKYRALGGPIFLILKPGNDHHPHSLKNPKPIVDFFTKGKIDDEGKTTLMMNYDDP